MPNRFELPPELEQLIEKRQNQDRRQETGENATETERRTGADRRQKNEEGDAGNANNDEHDCN